MSKAAIRGKSSLKTKYWFSDDAFEMLMKLISQQAEASVHHPCFPGTESKGNSISWAAWVPIAQLGLFQAGSSPAWCQWSGGMIWGNSRAVWAPTCPTPWPGVPAPAGCTGAPGRGRCSGECSVNSWAQAIFCFRLTQKVCLSPKSSILLHFFNLFWKVFKKVGIVRKKDCRRKKPHYLKLRSGSGFFWVAWIFYFPAFSFFWNLLSELEQGPRTASIPSKLPPFLFFFLFLLFIKNFLLCSMTVASARCMPTCIFWEQGPGISGKLEALHSPQGLQLR